MSHQCPLCRSEVHPQAVICPHCRSNLGFVRPLLERVASLEAEVKALKSTHSTALGQGIGRNAAQTSGVGETPTPPQIGRWRAAFGAMVAVALIFALHALLLFAYDLPPVVLRLATLLAPAGVAYLAYRGHQVLTGSVLRGGVFVALVSVIGMLAITSHIDEVPLWPQTARDWRETLEYALAIALGYLAGGQFARWIPSPDNKPQGPSLLVLLLKRDASGNYNVEALAERINNFATSAAPIASGAFSLYSGLRALLG